MIIYISM